jgi:glycosyltransferase involved in cell wall biosynthesis
VSTGVQKPSRESDFPLDFTLMKRTSRLKAARIICLLPVRNAEHDLPGYFESVERFADAGVALDDGSADGTRERLAGHPLVEVLLSNPPRRDYRNWDDGENRNRLLSAAAELSPQWIFSLDSDERLAADDASALRELVEVEASPGYAYLFRRYRLVGDENHYEFSDSWRGRLFFYEPGQEFPSERLHFVPIPTSIPRKNWIRSTVRFQHLGGATETRRIERFKKYLEADPDRRFQSGYTNIMLPPKNVRKWKSRPPGLPLLHNRRKATGYRDIGEPVISAIIISQNDEATIERSVASVVSQEIDGRLEVIVVNSGSDRTAEVVRNRFPNVRVIKLDRPVLPGEARNAGLRVATGRYVSFPGSHIEVLPGSLAARVRAHDEGYAIVTGTVINGTRTWAGWAAYFLEGSHALPGHPDEEFKVSPLGGGSYLREALNAVGGFPTNVRTAEDTEVTRELFRMGYAAYRSREASFRHYYRTRRPWQLIAHHFKRGRGEGRIRVKEHSPPGRLINRGFLQRYLIKYVPARVWWTSKNVRDYGEGLGVKFLLASPLVVLGAFAHCIGVWYEILRPAQGKLSILFRRWPGLPRRELRQMERSG